METTGNQRPGKVIPILFISSLLFAAMALTARWLMLSLPSPEITFGRMAVGAIFCIAAFSLRLAPLTLARPLLLGARGVLGGIAVFLYFTTIGLLSPGEATLLNNTYVIFIAALSPLVIREHVPRSHQAAAIVALSGVALVVGSGFSGECAGKFTGLTAAFFSAMAIMTIRSLRRDHSSMTIFFFFCLGGLVVSSLWSIRGDWRMPTAFESGMIVLMGLLSAGGQVLFTYALKFARALESSVFSQIVVVWVYIGQIVLWDEELTWMTAAGAVIIFLACIYLGAAGPQAEETPD